MQCVLQAWPELAFLFSYTTYACVYTYVYAIVIVLNVSEIGCIMWQYGVVEMQWLPLQWLFSNKTIIFIHATDSAPFSVFLAITHTLTKLKRSFTFDNFSVPFYDRPITVRVHAKRYCLHPTESLFILLGFFCFFFLFNFLSLIDSWLGLLIKDASLHMKHKSEMWWRDNWP